MQLCQNDNIGPRPVFAEIMDGSLRTSLRDSFVDINAAPIVKSYKRDEPKRMSWSWICLPSVSFHELV